MGLQFFGALMLGGLMGLFGQGIRSVVGLKTMVDQANAAGADQQDMFRAARFLVSLLIGFLAGIAATIVVGIQKLIDLKPDDIQLLLGIAAAGYAGADFIEGFMSQYLPGGKVAAKPGEGGVTNAQFDDIKKRLDQLGAGIHTPDDKLNQFPHIRPGSSQAVFRAKAPVVMADLIKDFGLTKNQAAGILGNLGVECAGFTVMQELHPIAGLGGYGWAQWTGPRRTEFMTWCTDHGLDKNSDQGNYGFLKHELETDFKGVIDLLKNTDTLEDAVIVVLKHYEMAGVEATSHRLDWAQLALNAFNTKLVA